MLVHKGGQINNVQLITGVRIVEMSQLQNYSVMCTKNGSYSEIKDKKSQGSGSGVMCSCVTRMEVIVVKRKKRGGGGGLKEDANVDVNREVKLSWKLGGGGGGGQGGCERRS